MLLSAYLLALVAGSVWSNPWNRHGLTTQLNKEQLLLESGTTKPVETGDNNPSASVIFKQMLNALETMQSQYFRLWTGTWPTSIDWTGAVINTAVSSTLGTVSRARHQSKKHGYLGIVDTYFAHNTAYYFGEDTFSIRLEAFDDILWVLLGWLENVKTIQSRNRTEASWYGTQYIPAFSHRARVFWHLASQGWDTDLCGGGMIWNPRLLPYKNTITNQLFISASVAMYLYFPGDTIDFPFVPSNTRRLDHLPARPHDPKYLQSAIDAYHWLHDSNMTNNQGLYVDGYHITGFDHDGIGTGKCDERNEMVYTYNQGVILSGQRGLWEATGNTTYLEDGYKLIRNIMAATGWSWSGEHNSPIHKTTKWSGLGQYGILEELCDRSASCSQDSQTFKGILFQHLTQFCETLPVKAMTPEKTHVASKPLGKKHELFCKGVGKWALHNAEAALSTKNTRGLFGTWWGHAFTATDYPRDLPAGAVDYRNDEAVSRCDAKDTRILHQTQQYIADDGSTAESVQTSWDVNDRGRGRTVETQQGGLAVLRSAWELSS
jgi:hypothetical protein